MNSSRMVACIAGALRRDAKKWKGGGGGVVEGRDLSTRSPPLRGVFALSQSLLYQNPIWRPERHWNLRGPPASQVKKVE